MGTVEYTYVAVSAPFKEDIWISAGEIRPTDRAHTHHVIAMVRPKGPKWMSQTQLGAEPWAPGPTRQADMLRGNNGDTSVLTSEFLVGYVPGMEAERFDIDQSAKVIPAGADLVLEVQHTTNCAEGQDQTKRGLELAPAPPRRRFMSIGAAQPGLLIKPGDPNDEAKAMVKFGQPVDLVYMQPHMHLRGKDVTIEALYPDGKRETLLGVPSYDFNWQIVCYNKTPVKLPRGTELHFTAHWDDSPANRWNPDPTATVRWGDQSWQQMTSAPMAVIVDRTRSRRSTHRAGGESNSPVARSGKCSSLSTFSSCRQRLVPLECFRLCVENRAMQRQPPVIDRRAFRRTAGQFATGVTVVAFESEGAVRAMTANSFTSLSLEPPLVLICLGRATNAGRHLHVATGFSVNILRSGQEGLSSYFSALVFFGGRYVELGTLRITETPASIVVNPLHCGSETIFVVDDEDVLRGFVGSVLAVWG